MIPALANHVWQSTWFAAAAALLALVLRRNAARVRFRVWIAASLKFCVPFALLAAAGGRLPWHADPAMAVARPVVSIAISRTAQALAIPLEPAPAVRSSALDWTWVLAIVWALGALAVVTQWFRRWRRMRAVLRSAQPMDLEFAVPVRTSRQLMEPGVCGILRPVLLVPEGMLDRLTGEQWRAVLAHEYCHVRRRDNLVGLLHLLVEAAFWFHPLVWWIGTRLVEERERACDEEVLEYGVEPEVYAESILRICRWYVEAPACAAGITGADLRKRIETILTNPLAAGMTLGKRAMLAACAALALLVPVAVGMLHTGAVRAQTATAPAKFDVTSVKRNTGNEPPNSNFPLGPGDVYARNGGYFSATGYPLALYFSFAYKLNGNALQSVLPQLPAWAQSDRWDIAARATSDPGKDGMRMLMRGLLADRFKLAVHYEDKEMPVMELVLMKSGKLGPELRPHAASADCPTELPSSTAPGVVGGTPAYCNGIYPLEASAPGRMKFGGRNVTLGFIADTLSAGTNTGRPLINQTGLSGTFDFTLEFVPPRRGMSDLAGGGAAADAESAGPAFEDALREQLGIKLQAGKGSVRVLVVDHVERPTGN